jgi:hypothetical protein
MSRKTLLREGVTFVVSGGQPFVGRTGNFWVLQHDDWFSEGENLPRIQSGHRTHVGSSEAGERIESQQVIQFNLDHPSKDKAPKEKGTTDREGLAILEVQSLSISRGDGSSCGIRGHSVSDIHQFRFYHEGNEKENVNT